MNYLAVCLIKFNNHGLRGSYSGLFSLRSGTMAVGTLSMARGALGFSLACRNNTSFNVDPADSEIKVTLTLPIIWITLSAITTVVTLPLLIAAWKNRNPEYLLPWLVLEPFLTFTGIGFASKDFILSTLVGQQHPIDSASSIGAILLVAAVDLCSVLVVYSYFRQLQGTHGHLSKPDDKMQNVVHEDHSYDRHFPEKTLPYQSTEPLISH